MNIQFYHDIHKFNWHYLHGDYCAFIQFGLVFGLQQYSKVWCDAFIKWNLCIDWDANIMSREYCVFQKLYWILWPNNNGKHLLLSCLLFSTTNTVSGVQHNRLSHKPRETIKFLIYSNSRKEFLSTLAIKSILCQLKRNQSNLLHLNWKNSHWVCRHLHLNSLMCRSSLFIYLKWNAFNAIENGWNC